MNKNPLKDCPSSPNCICTIATKQKKRLPTLKFSNTAEEAQSKLKQIIEVNPRATLVKEEDEYLHYEFITKLGKFTDDVEFYFDKKTKEIHFRSASRKGWSDLGKNKRRMKKISKLWALN